ncbi:MAG: hypothetical protein QOD58_588 [Mycobacterium sp.]|nr:hypothetical protein [Mycobacterium sp.]
MDGRAAGQPEARGVAGDRFEVGVAAGVLPAVGAVAGDPFAVGVAAGGLLAVGVAVADPLGDAATAAVAAANTDADAVGADPGPAAKGAADSLIANSCARDP